MVNKYILICIDIIRLLYLYCEINFQNKYIPRIYVINHTVLNFCYDCNSVILISLIEKQTFALICIRNSNIYS